MGVSGADGRLYNFSGFYAQNSKSITFLHADIEAVQQDGTIAEEDAEFAYNRYGCLISERLHENPKFIYQTFPVPLTYSLLDERLQYASEEDYIFNHKGMQYIYIPDSHTHAYDEFPFISSMHALYFQHWDTSAYKNQEDKLLQYHIWTRRAGFDLSTGRAYYLMSDYGDDDNMDSNLIELVFDFGDRLVGMRTAGSKSFLYINYEPLVHTVDKDTVFMKLNNDPSGIPGLDIDAVTSGSLGARFVDTNPLLSERVRSTAQVQRDLARMRQAAERVRMRFASPGHAKKFLDHISGG
jgi:hypothetical protein